MSKTFTRFEADNKRLTFISHPISQGMRSLYREVPFQVIDWSTHIGVYGTPIVEPKRMERCTGCQLCQLFCPDAAIDILRKGKERPQSK